MREIILTQGQVAIVDDWNYDELNQYKWYAMWCKGTNSFYARRRQGSKKIYMHREIMKTPIGMVCDHINHETLINTESNLRNVTFSQNQMNRKMQSNNKVGEKCIFSIPSGFMVQVIKNKQTVFCKTYKNFDDAIVARNKAIEKFHGEYGCL